MYMTKYPAFTCAAAQAKLYFSMKKDLPQDQSKWDELFLKVMGSPDVKQIDGMGGTVSSTSKIATFLRLRERTQMSIIPSVRLIS